jgi:hypothetical protein
MGQVVEKKRSRQDSEDGIESGASAGNNLKRKK